MIWVDLLSWILLVGGAGFCVIGGVGLLRLPEFFTRCHGAGITDTMGAGMILTGLMVQASDPLVIGKLLILLVFIFLTGPVAGHALFKAAFAGGLRIDAPLENHTGQPMHEEAPTVMLESPEESE